MNAARWRRDSQDCGPQLIAHTSRYANLLFPKVDRYISQNTAKRRMKRQEAKQTPSLVQKNRPRLKAIKWRLEMRKGKEPIAVSRCRPTLLMMRDVKVEIENANVVVESLMILNNARLAGLCLVAFVCEMTNSNPSTLQGESDCPLLDFCGIRLTNIETTICCRTDIRHV